MENKFSYSTDEETYHGEFSTPEEAALEGLTSVSPKDASCWVGRNVAPSPPESYFEIEMLMEHVSEQDEYLVDVAGGWYRATPEQEAEINEEVAQAIGKWLDKHGLRPTFWTVTDAQEWTLEDGKPVLLSASNLASG